MTAYNAAPYIEEAIQSILSQQQVSFELLVGDDGSTDDTWARICLFRSDPRVHAFRFKVNMGAPTARNKLIAKANGRYLSIADADDIFLPGNLKTLSSLLDKKQNVGVAYGDLQVINRKGKIITRTLTFPGPRGFWDLVANVVPHGGTMLRAALVKQVGGYRPQFPFAEDYDLFLRLAEITQFHRVAGKTLYRKRQLSGSLSDQPKLAYDRMAQIIRQEAIHRRYGISVSW